MMSQTPRSTEAALAEIWTEIVEQSVGAGDRFIDFTDSLSATEYVNRVRDTFHVDVPVSALFNKAPTVSKLAELIDRLATPAVKDPSLGEPAILAPAIVESPIVEPTIVEPAIGEPAPAVGHRPRIEQRRRRKDLSVSMPGGEWRVWRTAALRGAGFTVSMIQDFAGERAAAAARDYLQARADVDACRLAVLHELGTVIRNAPDTQSRAELRRTRRRIRQGIAQPDSPLASERELAAALDRRTATLAALAAAHTEDAERVNRVLLEILADSRFREAALWQNRTALSLAAQRLRDRRGSAGDRRNAATFVAMLAQRYATKNDSLGFFGPVGWAQLTDGATVVDVMPGQTLLSRREVYFEGWAIDAVAEALNRNPGVARWTTPRLRGGVFLAADRVYLPVHGAVSVSREQRRLLELCDGKRTAQQIAMAAVRETPPLARDESAVFDMLRELVEMKLIAWQLEVPSQLHPERDLAQRLARIGDAELRAECEGALRALTDARDRVRDAAGNDRALEADLAHLDHTFTRITGCAPSRRHGEMYAARGLVFEDCQRDCDIAFGREFLSRLGPPLSIVLDGARWVSAELRKAFTRHLRACHAQLRAALKSDSIDTHLFLNHVGARGRDITASISTPILERFQEIWREILSSADSRDPRRLTLDVADVAARAREAFAANGPSSWCGYFCPDVMIASPSLAAFRQGRFQCVLGEVHSNNTLLWSALVSQHPHQASVLDALAEDARDRPVVLLQTPKARWVSRLNVTTLPSFWRYEHGDDLPSLPACRSLPAGLLVAVDDGHGVRIKARDGRVEFDAYDLFAVTMSYEADRIVSGMLRTGTHSPRVTIGGLTVAREQWNTTPADMPFLQESDPSVCFARMNAWAREHGMPRYLFYKSAGETKPCYLDFDSPLYTAVFAKLMRRLRPSASVRIVEMLPALDDVWLTDRDGAPYTCEIRFVARRGDAA
jgi:hypothetical protein